MIYSISNEYLNVDISTAGAELMSVRSAEGTEYLWQGDKTYWGGRAYNLFPICGRLTEGKYTYRGKTYEMNLHGFLRKSELTAVPISDDKIDFSLGSNEKTQIIYPFDFEYHIIYALEKNTIRITITVENKDEKELIFALGGHHGFNVPIKEGTMEDYYLQFGDCAPRSVVMSDTSYTTRTTTDYKLEEGNKLKLRHSLFDNDAIILENAGNCVTLKSDKFNESVTLSYPSDMKYLGLWHAPKTEAPYISIEPWVSVPAYDGEIDDLETKRDMLRLHSGGVYTLDWSIEIN